MQSAPQRVMPPFVVPAGRSVRMVTDLHHPQHQQARGRAHHPHNPGLTTRLARPTSRHTSRRGASGPENAGERQSATPTTRPLTDPLPRRLKKRPKRTLRPQPVRQHRPNTNHNRDKPRGPIQPHPPPTPAATTEPHHNRPQTAAASLSPGTPSWTPRFSSGRLKAMSALLGCPLPNSLGAQLDCESSDFGASSRDPTSWL